MTKSESDLLKRLLADESANEFTQVSLFNVRDIKALDALNRANLVQIVECIGVRWVRLDFNRGNSR